MARYIHKKRLIFSFKTFKGPFQVVKKFDFNRRALVLHVYPKQVVPLGMKCLGRDLRHIIWDELNLLDKRMLLMAHGDSRPHWNRPCALIATQHGHTKLLKHFGTDKLPENACCFSRGYPQMIYTLLDLGLLRMCIQCINRAVRHADIFRLRAFSHVDGFEMSRVSYLFTLSLEKSNWEEILDWFYEKRIFPTPVYVQRVIRRGRIDILEWMHGRGLLYALSPCQEAVSAKNLKVVEWSRDQGYPWGSDGVYARAVEIWPDEF